MIDKLLRPFVCDQLKALMEKLESQEFDTRSLVKLGSFLQEIRLTRFERYVVHRVYRRVKRMHDMNRIIEEIIIGQTESDINMDINAKLREVMDASSPSTMTQSKRVVVRPRATTP